MIKDKHKASVFFRKYDVCHKFSEISRIFEASRIPVQYIAMKHIIVFLLIIVVLAGCGVFPSSGQKGGGKEPEIFLVAEWNVQALFDGQETGNEYGEYREAAGWAAEKYAARITAISQAIPRMLQAAGADTAFSKTAPQTAKVPGLIGFVELENAGVLEDLARGELSKYGYFWTAFAAIPGASLGIGILSRFPLSGVRAHSITVGKETVPRPVLEARVEPAGKPLVFLLCHWKSKLGGDIATEAQRRHSAHVVQRRLRELKETEAETPVIVMGDLNENHDEYYRHSGKLLSALLPDDPDAASQTASLTVPLTASLTDRGAGSCSDFLVISGEKPPRALSFPEGVCALYSPWEGEMAGSGRSPGGSYCYKNAWETIDHFLLSDSLFNGAGWNFASCRVLNHAPFTAPDGSPNAYVPRSGRGLSDHLPLLLCLRDNGD